MRSKPDSPWCSGPSSKTRPPCARRSRRISGAAAIPMQRRRRTCAACGNRRRRWRRICVNCWRSMRCCLCRRKEWARHRRPKIGNVTRASPSLPRSARMASARERNWPPPWPTAPSTRPWSRTRPSIPSGRRFGSGYPAQTRKIPPAPNWRTTARPGCVRSSTRTARCPMIRYSTPSMHGSHSSMHAKHSVRRLASRSCTKRAITRARGSTPSSASAD